MRLINKIIIHCSDSDVKDHDDISVIDQWHKQRGWNGVGYHYFIQNDGNIQKGRNLDQVGAHCEGHNSDSIGICLSGKHNFTRNQFYSLAFLIKKLQKEYDIKEIEGHNYYDKSKTCPNFDVDSFKPHYLYNDITDKIDPKQITL